MLLNSYLPITVLALIAVRAVIVFGYLYDPNVDSSPSIKAEIQRLLREVDRDKQNEEKIFANIYEKPETTERSEHDTKNLKELKLMLNNLLIKVNMMEKNKKRNDEQISTTATPETQKPTATTVAPEMKTLRLLRDKKKSPEQKWGPWTDWSACSVSCGKGRKIRWRHCNQECNDAETEMEEKACQLPACGPGKLFGVIPI